MRSKLNYYYCHVFDIFSGGGSVVGFFRGEGGLKIYWKGKIDVFAGS